MIGDLNGKGLKNVRRSCLKIILAGALLIPAADEVTPPPPGPRDACLYAPPRFKEPPPTKSAAEMPKGGSSP